MNGGRLLKILLLFSLSLCTLPLFSQGRFAEWLNPQIDTSYIEDYSKDFILRFYGSKKYSLQNLVDSEQKLNLLYKPSNGFTLGAGVNYKFLGLNIGLVYPFTTPDATRFGKTKMLDLQSHLYFPRFTFDFFTGYYKGQYLSNSEKYLGPLEDGPFYQRPDLRTYSVGFGIYTNLNAQRFSVRAPFTQNARQKRSAGEPMVGFEAYWVTSLADSSFVPSFVDQSLFFDGRDFNRWNVFTANLTAGYAYNFIIRKRIFLMLSLNSSLGIGQNRLHFSEGAIGRKTIANFGFNQRFGTGYQFNRLFVGVSMVNYQLISPTIVSRTHIRWNAGNMRFNVAYRLSSRRDLELRPWKWFSEEGYFIK